MLSTKKKTSIIAVTAIALGMFTCAWAVQVNIKISPNVLNIKSEQRVVTVNTDIPYSVVDGPTVTLESGGSSVGISRWESDSRGTFVAQFLLEEIKKLHLKIGEYNTFTLIGLTTDGQEFAGSQDVLVLPKNMPKK